MANNNIEYCQLSSGLNISRVVTGLWQIADLERSERLDLNQVARELRPYVEAGLTSFDMADHYGSAEEIVGIYHTSFPQEAVQLMTKWVPPPGPQTREQVREAVELALNRMKLDQLDLLQFHAWRYPDPNWLDCLFWLQELADEGLIGGLGLTNFDTAHLRIVLNSGIQVSTNQVCYSLLDQRAATGMSQLCQDQGIKILAFGTLAGGFLSDRWVDQKELESDQLVTWSQMKYKRFIDEAGGWSNFQSVLSRLKVIASDLGVSVANLASRYIMEDPAVGAVLIGARLGKSEHISSTLNLFQFTLTEAVKKEIAETLESLDPIPGDCGDEYRKPPFLTASGDLSHHVESIPPPYQPVPAANGSTKVFSGTSWEESAGYCRATRIGNRILVSGTTASHGDVLIGGQDPAAQTHFVIDKIEGAILSLGGQLEDVVRTRIFIQRMEDWEKIAEVHGERFGHIRPANTLIQAGLIGSEFLVEIEAEAVLSQQ